MSARAAFGVRLRAWLALLVAPLALLVAMQPAVAQSFSIERVAFPDSAYLSQSELQAVASRYTDRSITFSDLEALLAEVQGLYAEAGIVTARAILPPQDIVDGTLRVELVEAVVESIEIDGLDRTDPDFLRRNIGLAEGELPDFERLERDLRVFDIAHDIAPQLSFAAGGTPGTTRVIIGGEEPPARTWMLSADNFGRKETGELRASAFVRWSSVTGRRDILSLQAQLSRGARFAAAGYSLPAGPGGGRIVAAASYSRSDIVDGEFAIINVVARSDTASLAYSRPFRVRAASHWMLDTGVGYERNVSSTTGLAFSDIRILDAYVAINHTRRFALSSLRAGVGLRAGRAQAEQTTETEGSFWLVFANLDYARRATQNIVLEAELSAQIAPDQNLPVARLFTVGGPTTIRGYPINVRGGDSGLLARLQVSRAEPFERGDFAFRPFGFVDAAVVVPFRRDGGFDSDQDLLASIGAGLRMQYRDNASALLMAGVPLIETQGFTDTGRPTVYFGIDYRF